MDDKPGWCQEGIFILWMIRLACGSQPDLELLRAQTAEVGVGVWRRMLEPTERHLLPVDHEAVPGCRTLIRRLDGATAVAPPRTDQFLSHRGLRRFILCMIRCEGRGVKGEPDENRSIGLITLGRSPQSPRTARTSRSVSILWMINRSDVKKNRTVRRVDASLV